MPVPVNDGIQMIEDRISAQAPWSLGQHGRDGAASQPRSASVRKACLGRMKCVGPRYFPFADSNNMVGNIAFRPEMIRRSLNLLSLGIGYTATDAQAFRHDRRFRGAGRARPATRSRRLHPRHRSLRARSRLRAANIKTIAYNGQVPGPLLRLKEGRPVTIDVTNQTGDSEVVHWHGLFLPPQVDGAMEEGTPPIPAGGRARYTFTPRPVRLPLVSHPCLCRQRPAQGAIHR